MSTSFGLSEIATMLENRIRTNRIVNFPVAWQDEIIFPYYNGLALNNIAQTVAKILGANGLGDEPLDDVVWGGNLPYGEVERVIIYISDGMGYKWIRQMVATDTEFSDILHDITDGNGPVPLTSIAPSTTAVALPTLWTGTTPSAHGMLGTKVFLKRLSMVVSLLHFAPNITGAPRGLLETWGIDPSSFVPVPTLGEVLRDSGIPTYLFTLKELLGSGLSKIMHRGIENIVVHRGYSDMWLRMEDVLKETIGKKAYISIYWPAVDTLSHTYGAHNKYLHAEIKTQLQNLQKILKNPAVQDGKTLVMMIADHGHYDIAHKLRMGETPGSEKIYKAMRTEVSGDSRLTSLFLRHGHFASVAQAVDEYFADCLTWISGEDALKSGLFGPHHPHPEALDRIGDMLLIPRLGHSVHNATSHDTAISRHSGLSDWEMLIPLLWKRI